MEVLLWVDVWRILSRPLGLIFLPADIDIEGDAKQQELRFQVSDWLRKCIKVAGND
jgi:hypothetical protein